MTSRSASRTPRRVILILLGGLVLSAGLYWVHCVSLREIISWFPPRFKVHPVGRASSTWIPACQGEAGIQLLAWILLLSRVPTYPLSFAPFYLRPAPCSHWVSNGAAVFSWSWRSICPRDYWESQLRLKTSFHSNYIVVLSSFVKGGSLLSCWVTGDRDNLHTPPNPLLSSTVPPKSNRIHPETPSWWGRMCQTGPWL